MGRPSASVPPGATLEPVRMGRVIVHEWVYGQREWVDPPYPDMPAGFARIRYVERLVYKPPGSTEWHIADGRAAAVREFRRRNGR
jgi:hypothetical protein